MLPFYVYILRCRDGSYYTGHTDNLEKRIGEHYTGKIKCYTSTRRPVKLVYIEEFASRAKAIQTERQIKGWSRAKKEAYIKENYELLKKLSKRRTFK